MLPIPRPDWSALGRFTFIRVAKKMLIQFSAECGADPSRITIRTEVSGSRRTKLEDNIDGRTQWRPPLRLSIGRCLTWSTLYDVFVRACVCVVYAMRAPCCRFGFR